VEAFGGYLLSPRGSQSSRRVGAEARSFRSFVYRSSAALILPLAALGSVMLQAKRFVHLNIIPSLLPRWLAQA